MKCIADKDAVKAVAYMRTSSATNVGADKDSEQRQWAAIEGYAKRANVTVVDWFYDPAVSGAYPIETRPGFAELLDRIEDNGVRIVLIEDASRFARDLIAQEPWPFGVMYRHRLAWNRPIASACLTKSPSLRNGRALASEIQNSRILAKFSRCTGSKVSLSARSQSAAFSHGSTWNIPFRRYPPRSLG
jgi:hypothetical protein